MRAHGPIDEVQVDADLTFPGRGRFALRGPVDFLSKELGYDVVVDATALDLSRVLIGGPATMLNGSGRARGRGFKPATMYSMISVDLGPSSVDTIAVDSMSLRAVLLLVRPGVRGKVLEARARRQQRQAALDDRLLAQQHPAHVGVLDDGDLW